MDLNDLTIIQRISFMIGGIFYLIGWIYSLFDSTQKNQFKFFIIILFFGPSSLIYLLFNFNTKNRNNIKIFFIFLLGIILLIYSFYLNRHINKIS